MTRNPNMREAILSAAEILFSEAAGPNPAFF